MSNVLCQLIGFPMAPQQSTRRGRSSSSSQTWTPAQAATKGRRTTAWLGERQMTTWWSKERTMARKSLLHIQLLFLLSPSTSISSLLLLYFCSLKAIVFFFLKPEKDAPMQFVYLLFIKKKKSANRMAWSGSSNFLVSDRFEWF